MLSPCSVIRLIRRQNDRFLRAAQQVSNLLVGRGDAGTSVDHEDDYIGLFDSQLRLRPYVFHDVARLPVEPYLAHRYLGTEFEAACVDEGKFAPVPIRVAVNAITRGTGQVFHNGNLIRQHAVEKSRFADVRPADHVSKGLHLSFPSPPPSSLVHPPYLL